MFNLKLIFGNQYLEEKPNEGWPELESPNASPSPGEDDPCCRSVQKSECSGRNE